MDDTRINPWFLACAILVAIPVLIPAYPPMADLSQHVAAVMVLDQVHFGDYKFAEMFAFNWDRPYWVGYFLIWAFSQVFGYVWGAKLTVALSVVAFVLSLAWLRKEIRAPAVLDWLLLPIPFGFAYEWGFLSFIVAAPLGVLFLVSYHRFLAGRTSAWTIFAWMFVLFIGHLLILAFFCVIASAMALKNFSSIRQLVARIAPLLVSIPLGIQWLLFNSEARTLETPTVWNIGWHRVTEFLPNIFSLPPGFASVILALFLLSLPVLLGARPRWSIARVAPAVFYILYVLFSPSLLADNLGTNERFQMFGMLVYVLIFEDADFNQLAITPLINQLAAILPAVVGLGLLASVGLRSYGFHQESGEFRQLLRLMRGEERVLSLIKVAGSSFAERPVYMHLPVWYAAEQKGLVDFNFAEWPSMSVYYRPAYRNPHLPMHAEQFDWEKNRADQYRYFVVRSTPEFAVETFRADADKVRPLYWGVHWFLFERISNDP